VTPPLFTSYEVKQKGVYFCSGSVNSVLDSGRERGKEKRHPLFIGPDGPDEGAKGGAQHHA